MKRWRTIIAVTDHYGYEDRSEFVCARYAAALLFGYDAADARARGRRVIANHGATVSTFDTNRMARRVAHKCRELARTRNNGNRLNRAPDDGRCRMCETMQDRRRWRRHMAAVRAVEDTPAQRAQPPVIPF